MKNYTLYNNYKTKCYISMPVVPPAVPRSFSYYLVVPLVVLVVPLVCIDISDRKRLLRRQLL